jgi:hypothetical protein
LILLPLEKVKPRSGGGGIFDFRFVDRKAFGTFDDYREAFMKIAQTRHDAGGLWAKPFIFFYLY